MKNFILKGEKRARPISEYRPEYAGKIYCEGKKCGAAIFYVPESMKSPHFRVLSPDKHSAECDAKSINNKNPRKEKVSIIEGVPVLNITDEIIENKSGFGGLGKAGGNKKGSERGKSNTTLSLKRAYIKSLANLGGYIKQDFENKYDLPIIYGEKEDKLFNVIYTLKRFHTSKNYLVDKPIIVFGEVVEIKKTEFGDHISVYIRNENNQRLRIYVNKLVTVKLADKLRENRCVLVNGIYSSNYGGQIIINKSSDIYLFSKRYRLTD